MRTQVLFQTLLSVCLLIATTCYGQTGYKLEDLKVEKTGYDLQGTLRISQSYGKQTKILSLKMKNVLRNNHIAFLVSIAYTVSQEHIFRKPKDSNVFLHYMHLPRFYNIQDKADFQS